MTEPLTATHPMTPGKPCPGNGLCCNRPEFDRALFPCSAVNVLLAENAKLKGIIAQHDLCHDLHGQVQAEDFAAGCEAEQRKLYGCAPDADRVKELEAENAKLRAEVERYGQEAYESAFNDKRRFVEMVAKATGDPCDPSDPIDTLNDVRNLRAKLTEAEQRIAALVAALEPFAEWHDERLKSQLVRDLPIDGWLSRAAALLAKEKS